MKKSLVALAVLAASAAATAAPQANTFYTGAKAGWTSSHNGFTQWRNQGKDVNRHSVNYGVFGGYQITDNLAAELGYEYFGGSKVKDNESTSKHTAHGTTLALQASYPVLADLDVYGRVGAALIRSDYKETFNDGHKEKAHNFKVSPVLAAGVEYAILPELAARIEYQYVNKVGNLDKAISKTTKNSSSRRSISLDDKTITELLKLRTCVDKRRLKATNWRNNNLVFPGKFGSPRDPAKVSLKCKKLATAIGRPDFTMHDTRHTHATLLLEAGVNFKVVQMRLGHSSYQQTMDTYSHVTPIMEADVVEKISNIF